jgi:hypothetical protein
METNFEISLNMKTPNGIEVYSCFPIGKDEHFAHSLYSLLEGEDLVGLDSVITIDLIRRENGILFH